MKPNEVYRIPEQAPYDSDMAMCQNQIDASRSMYSFGGNIKSGAAIALASVVVIAGLKVNDMIDGIAKLHPEIHQETQVDLKAALKYIKPAETVPLVTGDGESSITVINFTRSNTPVIRSILSFGKKIGITKSETCATMEGSLDLGVNNPKNNPVVSLRSLKAPNGTEIADMVINIEDSTNTPFYINSVNVKHKKDSKGDEIACATNSVLAQLTNEDSLDGKPAAQRAAHVADQTSVNMKNVCGSELAKYLSEGAKPFVSQTLENGSKYLLSKHDPALVGAAKALHKGALGPTSVTVYVNGNPITNLNQIPLPKQNLDFGKDTKIKEGYKKCTVDPRYAKQPNGDVVVTGL